MYYRICPNKSAVHECKGLGARLTDVNNKACHPVPTTVVYMHIYGTRNHVDLCLQENGDLRMCDSQTDQKIFQILLFLGDLLMFY